MLTMMIKKLIRKVKAHFNLDTVRYLGNRYVEIIMNL